VSLFILAMLFEQHEKFCQAFVKIIILLLNIFGKNNGIYGYTQEYQSQEF
jgi:hypothetical protein